MGDINWLFTGKGLAEYMGGCIWHGRDANELAKEAFENNKISSIKNILTQQAWMNLPDEDIVLYYNVASSFVRFLIEKYGKEKFKNIYGQIQRSHTKDRNIKIFENVYGISFDAIEKEFTLKILKIS